MLRSRGLVSSTGTKMRSSRSDAFRPTMSYLSDTRPPYVILFVGEFSLDVFNVKCRSKNCREFVLFLYEKYSVKFSSWENNYSFCWILFCLETNEILVRIILFLINIYAAVLFLFDVWNFFNKIDTSVRVNIKYLKGTFYFFSR